MTDTLQADAPLASTRDHRVQTPLWRFTGSFKLLTPLHIGTGRDAPITLDEGLFNPGEPLADTARHVATVVRDHAQRPCIPASSFKGALHELARRAGMDTALRQKLFGAELARDMTQAAAVEFTYLYALPGSVPGQSGLPLFDQTEHPHVAHLPHVSRNRHTGAAEAQRLFLSQVLPPGVSFAFDCTARGLSNDEVSALQGLLVLAGHPDSGIRLGAGKAADQGRVQWHPGETRRLDGLAKVWAALNPPARTPVPALTPAALWTGSTVSRPQSLPATPLKHPDADWLTLSGLALKFHSPFLVYQRRKKAEGSGDPDGGPRTNHAGRAVLPSTSLHGALRAQAERILRTIGRETPAGYEVPGVYGLDGAVTLDLASVLFGAAGWRSLLRCSDFVDDGTSQDITHHMLAIDRLTGGGKDSAKFAVQVRDCPTLTGALSVDMARLRRLEAKAPGTMARVLGLLAHVLRDLDEGDVPLGYGAAKGYGQLRSEAVGRLRQVLAGHDGRPSLTECIGAFAALSPSEAAGASLTAPTLAAEEAPPRPSLATKVDDSTFHNPYVFIPFGTPQPGDTRLPWADRAALDNGQAGHHSHARYGDEAFHGRLVYRVTATTPIFIGAGDQPGTADPKEKLNYRLANRCALPATSLRGMVSSLHESITASRLRAATDRHYSVRYVNDMNRTAPNPSAIGRLIRIEGLPGLWLQMLAMPLLTLGRDGRAYLDKAYTRTLIQPKDAAPLKSLFGDVRTDMTPFIPETGKRPMYFMQDRLRLTVQQGRDGRCFVEFPERLDDVHVKQAGSTTFILGARRRVDELPQRTKMAEGLLGVVRVMRGEGRDLPDGRKHEVFVPYSQAQQGVKPAIEKRLKEYADLGKKLDLEALQREFRLLPVPDDVVHRFNRLADAVTATQDNKDDLAATGLRPYQPQGATRNDGRLARTDVLGDLDPDHRDRALRPQHSDIVYFRPNAEGTAIEEISYSSMWRREIALSATELVGGEAGHLLPNGTKPVEQLSPSELLFGAVEVRSAGTKDREPIAAWMSKVRFSAGVSLDNIQPGELQTLKILSSPKPPSPAMYFQPRQQTGGAYVSKAQFWAEPQKYQLKGRKVYLHAHQEFNDRPDGTMQRRVLPLDRYGDHAGQRAPWASDPAADLKLNNQKVRVRPLKAGSEFYFSIDFVNLSQSELESLCASLRPHADFEHKIGMGKPIGLGSIKVETVGLHLVDRRRRYAQLDFSGAPRYHAQWIDGKNRKLPAFLGLESTVMVSSPSTVPPSQLARSCMEHLKAQAPAVHRALVLTGDPRRVVRPVHYPQVQRQSIEEETFAWFVNNDKTGLDWEGKQQFLAGFKPESEVLPTLSRVARRHVRR